jgi:hypothetical protein
VDDAGEEGHLVFELAVLGAQVGEFAAEQVVVGVQPVDDLWGGGAVIWRVSPATLSGHGRGVGRQAVRA